MMIRQRTRRDKNMQNREVNDSARVSYAVVRKRCSEQPVGKNSDVVKSMQRHSA
jgi:hypothetical protein